MPYSFMRSFRSACSYFYSRANRASVDYFGALELVVGRGAGDGFGCPAGGGWGLELGYFFPSWKFIYY